MNNLFIAAWEILNIELSYEGIKFALWHPLAFSFVITLIAKILLFKSKED
jgi:hypothetical protein